MRFFENTVSYKTWTGDMLVDTDPAEPDTKMAFRGACCDAYAEGDMSAVNQNLREACPSCLVNTLESLLWDRSINQCRGINNGEK